MNRKMIGKGSFFGALAVALLTMASVAYAQEFRATITGTVTDPNGAVVPGATVIVKNLETNVATTVKTNDDGAFTVATLMPGKYNVSASVAGFKTSTRENVEVRVDDRLTVDFKLDIGNTAEVTIVATDEILERGSVTTGMVVSSRQVQELPLAEGAAYVLATQAPGVVYTGDPNFTGPTANGNLAGFRTNGTAGNLINLDGSPNLGSNGAVAFTPPSEAVQEFKVNTNSFDAQNGFTAGSTVNVAVKSGTNKFHGAVYYYNRDKSRTANNFFSNRQGLAAPERKYYRGGGTLNGPIFRDKTFFLFATERQNDNVAQPTTFFVPTALQRQGNFSEILGTTPIYDPASVFTGGTCPASNFCRTPFAGNIIPPARLKAYAVKYLSYYPLPNLPVQNGVGQYASNMNLHRPYKAYLGRIDHNFNGNNKIFGKYYYSKSQEDRYNWIGEPDSPTRGFEFRVNKGGNVDYTSMLRSNLIFDIRGSYSLFSLQRANAAPVSPADLGLPGPALAAMGNALVMPRMDFVSFASTNISNAIGSNRADYGEGRLFPFNLFSLQPMLTQMFGNHTLKYGYDFRLLHEKLDTKGFNAGRFVFDGRFTTACNTQPSPTTAVCPNGASNGGSLGAYGRDLAAFLLGIPSANNNSLIDNPTSYDVRSKYHGFFIQDDWRVNQKLTLNIGLRYEREGGIYDSQDRLVTGFDTVTANPLQAAAQANFIASPPTGVPTTFNVLGGLLFADGNNRAAQATDKNNIQPRIGVSYAVNDKTVLRAGFAIFTAPFQIQPPNQSGFSTPTLFAQSSNGSGTINTLDNPFPSGVAPSPGSSLGLATFIGRDLTVLTHERKNAQFKRFVVGIQRELPYGLGVEATFVGARGSDLPVARQINYIPLQYLNSTTQVFDAAVAANLSGTVPNPFRTLVPSNAGYNGATINRRSLLTAFPGFGNITQTEYNGTNTYYPLQLQLIKRFASGLSLNTSFTRSQEKEKSTRLNPQDADLTEQYSANDRPNRFTLSAIYELPIGRGRAIGRDWNRPMDAILGGWQFQTSYERQSGEPLLFGNVFFSGDPNSLKARLGGKDEQGRRYGIDVPAFDITGFFPAGFVFGPGAALPASISLGVNTTQAGANTVRYFPLTVNGLRNQRFLNFNIGMSKNFRIREGMKFQIRFEAINALNNPYFSAPNLAPANVANIPNLVTPGFNNLGRFGFTTGPTRQPPHDFQIGGRFTF